MTILNYYYNGCDGKSSYCLHVGAETITKVWRFDINCITDYTRKSVENDLIQLFPDIARKKLKLRMWYLDDLAGEVRLFSSIACIHEIMGILAM